MSLPVYDLSGMESILTSSYLDALISLEAYGSQARAYQHCKDFLVYEVRDFYAVCTFQTLFTS
jgi:hypothetical protein